MEIHERTSYPTDLTDAQWAIIEPLIPEAKHGGRPRTVNMREVVNTILYLNRTGCQWDMLPHDLLPKSTAYEYFARWRDDGTWAKFVDVLRSQVRVQDGREATPSAMCIDSQSVKTTEVGGEERGYDGGKKIKGRKRLSVIFGDNKYHNHALEAWLKEDRPQWHIEVKQRPEGTRGFTPLEKRWVVERTNAWNGRCRRNSKDYERRPESSAAMIRISNIHLMLRKLSPVPHPAFHYRAAA